MTIPEADYLRQIQTEWSTIETMLLSLAALNEVAFRDEADSFEPVILGALLASTRLAILRGKVADEHGYIEICRRVYRRAKEELQAREEGRPAPSPDDMSMFEVG